MWNAAMQSILGLQRKPPCYMHATSRCMTSQAASQGTSWCVFNCESKTVDHSQLASHLGQHCQ